MELLKSFLKSEISELNENNVQLHTIGQIEKLPPDVQKQLEVTRGATAKNTGLKLVLALSYGSRQEIALAVQKIAREIEVGKLTSVDIDEALITRHLDTADYPDPELLIRTSGEMRISNFLLWQISYTELVVLPVLWPDFRKEHFLDAVREFGNRQRRFGGVPSRSKS
jgi:undecaprenyl diphosphate synthase